MPYQSKTISPITFKFGEMVCIHMLYILIHHSGSIDLPTRIGHFTVEWFCLTTVQLSHRSCSDTTKLKLGMNIACIVQMCSMGFVLWSVLTYPHAALLVVEFVNIHNKSSVKDRALKLATYTDYTGVLQLTYQHFTYFSWLSDYALSKQGYFTDLVPILRNGVCSNALRSSTLFRLNWPTNSYRIFHAWVISP